MITNREFLELVIKMRSAQKDFYINHSQQALTKAKQLERRVDAAALELANAQPQQATFMDARSHDAERA